MMWTGVNFNRKGGEVRARSPSHNRSLNGNSSAPLEWPCRGAHGARVCIQARWQGDTAISDSFD